MNGIATTACIPMRKKPGEIYEMVSQVLFGETYEVLEQEKKFTKIKLNFDGYTGWISNESVCENNTDNRNDSIKIVSEPHATIIYKNNNETNLIPGGAECLFSIEKEEYANNNQSYTFINEGFYSVDEDVYKLAMKYLNAPYLWGGRTIMGIDCSGLVQIAFKIKNIKLPRDASQQILLGKTIESLSQARKGDLAFFNNQAGGITHVGILDGNGKIIHSSGMVRIEIITEDGILNQQSNSISHQLHSIKRL